VRAQKDPLRSPVYGDFEGFPPTYFVTGTRDMFLSDTVRTHRKMRVAGVPAELNVYEALSHAEYMLLADSPESRQAFDELGEFLRRHLPCRGAVASGRQRPPETLSIGLAPSRVRLAVRPVETAPISWFAALPRLSILSRWLVPSTPIRPPGA